MLTWTFLLIVCMCTACVVSKLSYVNAQGLYPSRNYFFTTVVVCLLGFLAGKFVHLKPLYRGGKNILEPGFKTDEVVNIYAAKGKFLFSTSSWFLNASLTLNANSHLNDNLQDKLVYLECKLTYIECQMYWILNVFKKLNKALLAG